MAAKLGRSDVRIQTTRTLRERGHGDLTGQVKSQSKHTMLDYLDALVEDLSAFRRRIKEALENLVMPALQRGQTVLVVSHSHVMRELARSWMMQRGDSDARAANGQAWVFSKDEVMGCAALCEDVLCAMVQA